MYGFFRREIRKINYDLRFSEEVELVLVVGWIGGEERCVVFG